MYHKVQICAPIISLCAVVVAIFVTGCCISGCRSSRSSDTIFATSTPDTPAPLAATLSWDAPTTYTDGSPLLDLKEYRVYFSTSPDGPYSAGQYYSVSAPATSVKVKDVISLGTGTYYFVVTAVDSTGWESIPSNEVGRYLN